VELPVIIASLVIIAAFLITAAISDLRHRRISNRLNSAFALSYVVFALLMLITGKATFSSVGMSVLLAGGVFLLFALFFYLGAMGGGDVKLAGAAALWVPAGAIPGFLIMTALFGGLVALATLIHARFNKLDNPEVPYGVAIAAGGLWVCSQKLFEAS